MASRQAIIRKGLEAQAARLRVKLSQLARGAAGRPRPQGAATVAAAQGGRRHA